MLPSRGRRRSLGAFRLGLVSVAALAMLLQAAAAKQAPLQSRVDKTPHRVPRATSAIRIDGNLDESAWKQALRLELPYEVNPGENLETAVRTEALLTYDESRLYAAFRAHDADASAIRARLSDRDRAFQDDFVGIVVDTFNDERRAFEFFVNPLGVQMDLIVDDVGGGEDSSWDAIWSSAGQLNGDGYVVEMAIPYTSLRFQRGEGDQVWGLDLVRIYPRDHRYLLALNPRDRSTDCYLCQVSKIVGFSGATPGKNFEITPTFTATRTDRVDDDAPELGMQSGDPDYEPGVTAKWGVTPNLILSGTVNPDFSQVEADAARLDVNEQFTLFFPEKRPFFLEGADFFDTPINAVHTRQVAAPEWGVKLTGKEGRNAMGVYVAQDDTTNLIFPGSEGSSSDSLDQEALAGVFRYRWDLGESSTIGGLLTAREGDDYHNRVLGIDALLRPTPKDTVSLQFLGSQTDYPDEIVDDRGQPEAQFDDRAFELSYRHGTRNWFTRASYEDFGRNFRSDLGFVPRVDYRMAIVGAGYTWWGEPDDWYARFETGGDWDQTEDQDGNLIEREVEGWFNLSGPKQSFFWTSAGHRTRHYLDESFTQNFWHVWVEARPTASLFVGAGGTLADQIDFRFQDSNDAGAARQGDLVSIEASIDYRFGRRVRLNLDHELRSLAISADGARGLPSGDAFRAAVSQMRLIYQLNVRAFFRAILQYTDVERDPAVYPIDIDIEPEVRDLFSQLLFSWKLNPQTAVFVGYSDQKLGSDGVSLTRADRTFFLKLGYAWIM